MTPTSYARLILWAGQESAWLEALAVGLVQAKAYVPAQACRKRAAEIEELVRSLGAEPEREVNADLLEACERAAGCFRDYEAIHASKGDTDKARLNGQRAADLEAVISKARGEPVDGAPEVESETERLRRLGGGASPYDPAGIARERAANRRQP